MAKTKHIKVGNWEREFNYDWSTNIFCTIISSRFVVQLTGGSVRIFDRAAKKELCHFKGYNYLYTGDIKPDESQLFALENGKHFYIFSLEKLELIKKVTLPRCYEAIDVYGTFSDDGKSLFVPVQRYSDKEGYIYQLCEYETETYTLQKMDKIPYDSLPSWPE